MKANFFTELTFTGLDLDGDEHEFRATEIAQVKPEDELVIINIHWGGFPIYGLAIQLPTVQLVEQG